MAFEGILEVEAAGEFWMRREWRAMEPKPRTVFWRRWRRVRAFWF